MLIVYYDPKSKSTTELVPFLDQIADALAKEKQAGRAIGKLGACDVTRDTLLGEHQAPEMMRSWQKFTANGSTDSFKFGRPRYYPVIIMFYRDGARVEEYTGVVKPGSVVSYLLRQLLPLGGMPLTGPHAVREFLAGEGPYVLACGLMHVGEASIKAAADEAAKVEARRQEDAGGAQEAPAGEKNVSDEDVLHSWALTSQEQHGSFFFGRAAPADCDEALGLESALSTSVRVLWARGAGAALGTPGGPGGVFRVLRDEAILGDPVGFGDWLDKHRAEVLEEMTPDNSYVFLDKPFPLVILLATGRVEEPESFHLFEQIEDADGMEYFQFVWSDCHTFAKQFDVQGQCPVVLLVDPESLQWESVRMESLLHPESTGPQGAESPPQRLLSWLWLSSQKFDFPANSTVWKEALAAEGSRKEAIKPSTKAKRDNKRNEGEKRHDEHEELDTRTIRTATDFEDLAVKHNAKIQNADLTQLMTVLDMYWMLLADLAQLRIGYEELYSHISFDWSPLEEAQALNPRLRLHAETYEDVALIMEDRERLKKVRKGIEIHDNVVTALEDLHSGRKYPKGKKFAKLVDTLHKDVKKGWLLLSNLHQQLFRTLHSHALSGSLGLEPPAPKAVERRDASTLSVREFVEEYAEKRQPVIITGLKLDEEEPWTLDFFRARCNASVQLKSLNLSKRTWGGLQTAGELRLPEFIDSFRTNATRRHWYLHDWPLPSGCPEVFGPPPYRGFTMPKYFAGDYFQRAAFDGYQHTWPSLFVGSGDTASAMHVDSGGTHFWLYLLSGRKQWAFYSAHDTINLYNPPMGTDFMADPFQPDFDTLPLHRFAQQYTAVQEPGELVFVPAGNPHAVKNMEAIHGVSMNYVDVTNIQLHLWHSLVDKRWSSFELFTDESAVPQGLRSDQEHLRFGEWKSQPWHEFTYDI